jgi:large subunit ribosomal protein L10
MHSDKNTQVTAIAIIAQASTNMFLADLISLKANQMNAIRAEAKKHGITTRITKNTLVKIALQNSSFLTLAPALKKANIIFFFSERC